MFVDSQMTSMVQLALCAYAIRRYLENPETQPLDSDRDLQEVKRGSRIKEANCTLWLHPNGSIVVETTASKK